MTNSQPAFRPVRLIAVIVTLSLCTAAVTADELAYTVLADFEDDSTAASIGAVRNVLAGDCKLTRESIPARGQGCLALEIGATRADASVVCELRFRKPVRFARAHRVATYCWINSGSFDLAFLVRSANGKPYETAPQRVADLHRWGRVSAPLNSLTPVRHKAPLAWPIEFTGYRVTAHNLGKQNIYIDDLLIEHEVPSHELVRGEFELDEPTHIYEPGARAGVAVVLENQSREQALSLSVELAWTRPDGTVLERQRSAVTLQPSGEDFRSRRNLDFTQRVSEPGLYRLVAKARSRGWRAAQQFETAIAVTPSNRQLSRGRSTFFGMRSNLLREPAIDRALEVQLARDMGVNLLAIDAPWRRLEPKSGTFELGSLLATIDAIIERDMAPFVVLTDLPDWAARDPARRRAQLATLLTQLAERLGQRVERYLITDSVLSSTETGASLALLQELSETVRAQHDFVTLYPPVIDVTRAGLAREVADLVKRDPEATLVFATSGNSHDALAQLEVFRQSGGFLWQPSHCWWHDAAPLGHAGGYLDAEAVLRHYVGAAVAGVGTLIWSDLRDDDHNPADPIDMGGVVRRDFSPKATLLGYVAAAGQLTGYRCIGPVTGTPAAFESGLFIGSNRQVAVLIPQANQVLPGLLSPDRLAAGEFDVLNFERQRQPLLRSAAPPLVPTGAHPLFVALNLREPQPEPAMRLQPPWLRVPRTAFCGVGERCSVRIAAPFALTRSYLQVLKPDDAPYESSITTQTLAAEANDELTVDIALNALEDHFERSDMTLRVAIEGRRFDVPIDVRRLRTIPRMAVGDRLSEASHCLAIGQNKDQGAASAAMQVFGGYAKDAITLRCVIEDDRATTARVSPDGQITGDHLQLGIVRAGRRRPLEMWVPLRDGDSLRALSGGDHTALEACSCIRSELPDGRTALDIRVAASALDAGSFRAGDRLRVAAAYVDDDDDGFAAQLVSWGNGLDGSASTDGYCWLELE